MSRIVPLLSVVVLLVAGGFMLSRDRGLPPTAAAATGAGAEAEAADAEAAGDASADEASADEASGDADATVAPPALPEEPPVPEGFVALPPLVEERRTSFERAEQQIEADTDYAAVIETNRGVIVIDLYQDQTPITVNSFVFLARHRYFDGIVFHRVLEDFMAQTGDPTGTGTGGPGYQFDDEIVPELQHDAKGIVSMANAGRGTNGSQFFITFAPTPWLDGAHTVFGHVMEGLDVLDDLTRVDPQAPAAAARLTDPVSAVREAGVDLDGDETLGAALEARLGAMPVPGQPFEVGGFRGVIGSIGGEPAVGFFPFPDVMQRVTIVTRPLAEAAAR